MKVGLTEHATEQLGDLVFINLPEVGDSVEAEGDIRRCGIRQGRL